MAGKKAATPSRHSLSGQIRDIIASRSLTAYAVGQLADVDPTVIGRFLSGERDLRLGTADKIAAALGLRLVEVVKPARGRPAGRKPAGIAKAKGKGKPAGQAVED